LPLATTVGFLTAFEKAVTPGFGVGTVAPPLALAGMAAANNITKLVA
jgi:hypothetical protein